LVYTRKKDGEEAEDQYRTEIGGILTLCVKALFIACCIYYLLRMLQKLENK
jgi:hypothetical protein